MKNVRKWSGLICAILLYYIIHEGAHLIVALAAGTFERIRIVGFGLGVQIVADTFAMSGMQIFIFCIVGAVAALAVAYILVLSRKAILSVQNKTLQAVAYYTTLALLLIDPIQLSVLHNFIGGGDMNGITQMGIPVVLASLVFAAIGAFNLFIIIKYVYRDYKKAFAEA